MTGTSSTDLVSGLERLIRAAEELKGVPYTAAEQDIFDDEAKSYVRKNFGPSEASRLHNLLVGPLVLYSSEQEQHALRVRTLARAQNRLRVLLARVERGEHRETEDLPVPQETATSVPRRVFVAHSGEPPALYRLQRFLDVLGVEARVAEWLPFQGRQVPEQARSAMEDCVAAIVFATRTDVVDGRPQPGRGALIETGILQERFGDRVIYLVEEGASFGPMADSFAHESFSQECLERAFHRIVVELKSHGII